MSVKEFEGKNEEEAINKAIETLGLRREDIDVEIVEARKAAFLFGSGKVKIRVHLEEERDDAEEAFPLETETDFEKKIVEFLSGLVQRIGLDCQMSILYREKNKLGLDVETQDSGILIGKRGSTLEAIQLLANVVAGRLGDGTTRIVVDTQNYRSRREKSLIRLAQATAAQVRRTGESRLLEAMNPFERRLVHTELGKTRDIETVSEGDGLYKRIRVSCRRRQDRP